MSGSDSEETIPVFLSSPKVRPFGGFAQLFLVKSGTSSIKILVIIIIFISFIWGCSPKISPYNGEKLKNELLGFGWCIKSQLSFAPRIRFNKDSLAVFWSRSDTMEYYNYWISNDTIRLKNYLGEKVDLKIEHLDDQNLVIQYISYGQKEVPYQRCSDN